MLNFLKKKNESFLGPRLSNTWPALMDSLLNPQDYTEFHDSELRIDYTIKAIICFLLGRTHRPQWKHGVDNGHWGITIWAGHSWSIMSMDCYNAQEWEFIEVGVGWRWNSWWVSHDIDGNC